MSNSTTKISKKSKIKSTGTGKNTALLGIQNNTEPSNENNINDISTKRSLQKSINEKSQDNLAELESKTYELQSQLDNLNSEIEQEKNLLMQDTYQFNSDLTEKGFEINSLSSENKMLMTELKDIKNSIDDKMKLGKIYLTKMEQLKKMEAKLNKEIEVKDKQIEQANKNQKIIIKDFNRIKEVSENNDEGKEAILTSELENLEKMRLELENENKNLRKIIKEHKLCPKKTANLKSKLNVITNSYQFEVKKTNMLESDKLNLEEKKEKIKKEIEEKKEKKKNRSPTYDEIIRNKVLTEQKAKNAEKIVMTSRASNYISNICNSIGDDYKKKLGDLKNTNNNDYKLKQNILFTENEQLKLASIIPPSYLNEFKERFEAIDNQRYELADKLKNNHDKHNNMKNSVKIKLNYTELKKKEQKMLFADLNSNLSKKNENISKLKTEINKITREYNNWNKLLKMKNNENIKLNKYIMEIKNNKNGEIKEKEKENGEISKRSYKGNKKKEINLQEQHNINLVYDMEK